MKIRIQGNKLRFRLKQHEVESFAAIGTVKEVMTFGPELHQRLQFTLAKTSLNEFSLQQDGASIELSVPEDIALDWTTSSLVGFEKEITTIHGSKIQILVEKDFECIDGKEEDNIGAYPNPRLEH